MDLALTLPEKSTLPLYKQLADAIRGSIADGKLRPGQKLPSSRALAESLSVSRETASRTYAELASQGYIRVTAGSGVFVNEDLPPMAAAPHGWNAPAPPENTQAPRLSQYGERIMTFTELDELTTFLRPEFNYQAPTIADLPVKRWREMLAKSARLDDPGLLAYMNDPFGFMPLRKALAAYLARRRAISCTPDQIAIFNTTEGGTDLLCRLLLNPGDAVAVENPGTPGVRLTFATNRARLVPIPVDADGFCVDHLRIHHMDDDIRMLYVTPSHHDPTGVVLSPARRQALVDLAGEREIFVIEDDFDSEYRYGERPVPALKGIDRHDLVIYRYNFWRSLYPLVRIGFVVLPRRLIPLIWRVKSLTERDVPLLEQCALSALIEEGHLERHMRRTLAVYSRRRIAFAQSLKRDLKDLVSISPISAGMHVLVKFSPQLAERRILQAAADSGLPVLSTAHNYMHGAPENEFIIGFAYTEEEEMRGMLAHFCRLLLQ